TVLKPNELLTEIWLPALPRGAGTAYVSFDQAASGYALVCAAALVALAKAKLSRAELAFTGLADTPFLATLPRLVGTARDGAGDMITQVAGAAVAGGEPNEEIHASGGRGSGRAPRAAPRGRAG